MKKTSMLNPVESLEYINCYSSSSPRLVRSPSNTDLTVRRSAVNREDLKQYWTSEKGYISLGDKQAYYLQVFQRLY